MRTFSEAELPALASELVAEIRGKRGSPFARVALSGTLGAGKSTLARHILTAFGIRREAEGSPTFAIAHEYTSGDGVRVIHADGYRLKSEHELEATGLLESLWDPEVVVLFEWLDQFPVTELALRESPLPTLWLSLGFATNANERTLEVMKTGF